MHQVRLLIHHLQRGLSQRMISRELGLSRNTVKLYVSRILGSGKSLNSLQKEDEVTLSALVYAQQKPAVEDSRKEDFLSRVSYFHSELKRTGVTKKLLWQEYKAANEQGYEYTRFCELLAREDKLQHASMHFSYEPGRLLQVDFAGDKLYYVDRQSGEMIFCPVLVCVLPYSGYSYVVALENASLPQFIKGLNQCLSFFGGAPLELKSDNMKQYVKRSCRYEPVFTQAVEEWGLHHQITLLAARVRKPRDKALVENEVRLSYQRIYAPLRDEVFFSLQELNTGIEKQLSLHHSLPLQKKGYSRQNCFVSEEKPLLQPLPTTPFVIRHCVEAKVQKNYHITLGEDWHHYSVPFIYIGKNVQVNYCSEHVEIFFQNQRIALHKRGYKRNDYTTVKEHMPENHRNYFEQQGWDEEYFLAKASSIGPSTRSYVEKLLASRHFPQQSFNACLGLLRLGKSYGQERLEKACQRALLGNSYTYRTLCTILENGADLLQREKKEAFSLPEHVNLRGAQAYQ